MWRFGIDGRAGLGHVALGLVGGVIAWRYGLKPVLHKQLGSADAQPAVAAAPTVPPLPPRKPAVSSTAPASPAAASPAAAAPALVKSLDDMQSLEELGRGVSLVLFSRGHAPAEAAKARAALVAAAQQLSRRPDAAALRFYVVDDASAQIPAVTLQTRLGITYEKPFVMLLDQFLVTERKYLSTDTDTPTASSIQAFVNAFLEGKLKPAMLGQPRPPGDASASCSALTEVVTDSFRELVLDPQAHVLLECYTRKCDACKAFAPRYRMLARLVQKHLAAAGAAASGSSSTPGTKLRIAAMDILDNDKDPDWIPEKWTPSLRLFPALKPGEKQKHAILLQYDPDANLANAAAVTTGVRLTGHDSTSATGQKVFLPTLPALLQFVEAHTALKLPQALHAEAAAQEEEALVLESAYDSALTYMQLWKDFTSVLEQLQQSLQAPAGGDVASPAVATQRAAQLRALTAGGEELKAVLVEAYNFIMNEAGNADGHAARAMVLIDKAEQLIERYGIARLVETAAAASDEAEAAQQQQQQPPS